MSLSKKISIAIVVLFIGLAVALKVVFTNKAKERVDQFISSTGIEKDRVSYDVMVDFFGTPHIKDIVIKNPTTNQEVKIDEFVLLDFDDKHKTPWYINLKINGIHLDRSMFKYDYRLQSMFDTLKKDEIVANISFNYSFDEKNKQLDIKDISYGVDDLGKFYIKTNIYNINSLDELFRLILFGGKNLKFGASSIGYKDYGLANIILSFNAKQQGLSLKRFKENTLKEIDTQIDLAQKQGKMYELKLLNGFKKFINDPKSFEISISPKSPVSSSDFRYITDIEKILKQLNLSIIVN